MKTRVLIFTFYLILGLSCSNNSLYRKPSSKSRIQDSFNFYTDRWLATFNQHEFQQDLKKIIQENKKSISKKKFSKFKKSRIKANMLRNHFLLFSDKQQVPEVFNVFVIVFGRLNDALENKSRARVQEHAHQLSQILKKHSMKKLVNDPIAPISRNKFKKYINVLIKDLKRSFSARRISQEELHQARKRLKLFLNIYKEFQRYSNENLLLENGTRLDDLVTELGNIHDDYVTSILTGKNTKSLADIKLSKSDREDFFKVLKQTKRDLFGGTCKEYLRELFL